MEDYSMYSSETTTTTQHDHDEIDVDTEDDGEAALSAALAGAAAVTITGLDRDDELHVDYGSGATPLFMALEEARWTDSLELLEANEQYTRTWVQSTGSHENTTFGWSVWRRLPIHEACRRQAPAWLVAALIRDYPASVTKPTHFGALPLHLAVEMGASPEVVNLLLIAFWKGIVHKDNSGRTPVDILQVVSEEKTQYYDPEAVRVVEESLRRCRKSYETNLREWRKKIDTVNAKHERKMRETRDAHAKEVKVMKKKNDELEKTLKQLAFHIDLHKSEKETWESQRKNQTQEHSGLVEKLMSRQASIKDLEGKLDEHVERIQGLEAELEAQQDDISSLRERNFELESDLQQLYKFQHVEILQKALAQARKDFKKLADSHQALEGMLAGQGHGMELILKNRSIVIPDTAPPPPPRPRKQKVKDALNSKAAAKAAADAAMKALQMGDAKEGQSSQTNDDGSTTYDDQLTLD